MLDTGTRQRAPSPAPLPFPATSFCILTPLLLLIPYTGLIIVFPPTICKCVAKSQIANPVTSPVPTQSQISYLEDQFCSLKEAFYDELIQNKIKVEAVKKILMGLSEELKEDWFPTVKKSGVLKENDISELCFSLGDIWNFVDYGLLEYTINRMCGLSLQKQMSRYVTDMSHFMRNTTVSSLMDSWKGKRRKELPEYEEVPVKVYVNPQSCTLEKLKEIRKKITDMFLPRLSDLAMLLDKVGEGSVLVTWLLPRILHSLLVKRVFSHGSQIIFGQSVVFQFCFEDNSLLLHLEKISEGSK